MLSICAMSDLHGDLININPCDLVLICGDSVPLNVQRNSKGTERWYSEDFKYWAEGLPCEKVLFIAGNHDTQLEYRYPKYKKLFPNDSKVTYLCNEEYNFTHNGKSYRIYGTPYCKIFGNWAFMQHDEILMKIYSLIPKGLDILMSHDAPYGYGDVLLQENFHWADGSHIGNKELLDAILESQPKIQVNGHLHSCSHSEILIENTKHYNVSIKDEFYNTVYEPLYLELS